MTEVPPARVLNVPKAASAHFRRNFINLAVCELRFPTLLELETQAPVAFQKAIRREYPHYQKRNDLTVNPLAVEPKTVHTFQSKNGRWIVSLRQASISLETAHYDSFEVFVGHLREILPACKFIDTDFFTRVGLRYINALPEEANEETGWVSPELVGPLTNGTFGTVGEYWQTVRGALDGGAGFSLRHGFGIPANGTQRRYVVDTDFYREDVPTTQAEQMLSALHERTFDLFWWTLGEKARSFLQNP